MTFRRLGLLVIRRVRLFFLFFYYLGQGFEHLEREAHYAAVLASTLEVESLIVVVGEHLVKESLVVVEALGPLWDGFVLYLACLLTHLPDAPPCPPIVPVLLTLRTPGEAHELRGPMTMLIQRTS